MTLTDKQIRFCQEYVIDGNGKQAAIRAGYSEKTAEAQASRLLSNVKVKKRISEIQSEISLDLGVDAKYVRRRLMELVELDVGDLLRDDGSLKPIKEWPTEWRKNISGIDISEIGQGDDVVGILKRVKWPDKVRGLELLGKHIDVQAFKERQETELKNLPPVLNISLSK